MLAAPWPVPDPIARAIALELGQLVIERQVVCAPPTAFYLDFAVATGSRASHVRQKLAGVPSPARHVRMRQGRVGAVWGVSPTEVSIGASVAPVSSSSDKAGYA